MTRGAAGSRGPGTGNQDAGRGDVGSDASYISRGMWNYLLYKKVSNFNAYLTNSPRITRDNRIEIQVGVYGLVIV